MSCGNYLTVGLVQVTFFSLGLSVLIWNPGLWADKREASSSTSASNTSSQSL